MTEHSLPSQNTLSEDDLIGRVTALVRQIDPEFQKEGGSTRHWVRDFFLPALTAAGLQILPLPPVRRVTTPHDDPIVQACVANGGHDWAEDRPRFCDRCWFHAEWPEGKPYDPAEAQPVRGRPQA